jgi:cytochrome b561
MYIRLEVQRDAHGFFSMLYFTILALHVSGAICTHNQEHKLQSTAVGTCDWYGVLEFG